MPKCLRFELSEEQEQELLWHRDHDSKPYLRERSAALLLLATGVAACEVAEQRLLQPRNEETVRSWYWRYRREGFAGLRIRTGRGRKPAFSPCAAQSGSRQRRPVASGAA
jgi:hypothetical protein